MVISGPVDNEELNVTRQMIHDLWTNLSTMTRICTQHSMCRVVATNPDNCPMIIWKGLRIVAIKMFKGDAKELVNWIDKTLQEYGVPISNFAFDATGIR